MDDALSAQLSSGESVDSASPSSPSLGQWPSVAYLFNVQTKDSCTVSIVDSKWLLTSLKCMESKRYIHQRHVTY